MADGTYYPSETTADYGQTTNNVGYETNKRALETDREDYVNAKRANYNGKLMFYGFKLIHFSALTLCRYFATGCVRSNSLGCIHDMRLPCKGIRIIFVYAYLSVGLGV